MPLWIPPRNRHLGIRNAFTTYYTPLSILPAATTAAVAANRAYYVPFDLGPALIDRISIQVTVGAAGNVVLALYTNVNGMPSALIAAASAQSTGSIAVVEASITALTLPDAPFWVLAHFDATPTVVVGTAQANDLLGSGFLNGASRGLIKTSETYAATAPATAYVPDALSSTAPIIGLRKAA